MGRLNTKHVRFYADGYDLSGDTSSIGPLMCDFPVEEMTGLNWAVKGSLLGQPTIGIGTLNGVFNSATSGLHELAAAANAERSCMVAIGDAAAPAKGDPVFCGKFAQKSYQGVPGEVMITATAEFGPQYAASLNYDDPWGDLLHAYGEETAANTGSGVDGSSATSAGGYMVYQIFSVTGESGSVTISVEDSVDTDDGNFGELLTSGAIDVGDIPCAGIVQLGTTATVKQYTRWQIAFDTATAATFALAFVRG